MGAFATSPDIATLYEAAGIEPHLSTDEAATRLASLVAENTRLSAEIDRQTRLISMSVDQGAMQIDVVPTREVVINWVLAARDMLGDAANYAETTATLPASVELGIGTAGERYTVTIQRQGKLTPHQARLQAENAHDRLRAAVLDLADEQEAAASEITAAAESSVDVATARTTMSQARAALATKLRAIATQP